MTDVTNGATPGASAVPDPLAPAKLGPITLRNRVIKAATWEGMAPGGLVSEDLIEYHMAAARGGIGMTTVAYLAVAPEGRTELNQIYWRPEALAGLRKLTDAIHTTGAKVQAQIGHAGPVSDSSSTGLYTLSPTKTFNPLSFSFNRQATKEDIERVTRQHAEAAKMAIDVGFDSLEVHLGHNYFASSFLSPGINKRKDEYGGSLENRAKVARGVLAAVKEAVGDQIAVTAKLNMEDGVKTGIQIDESMRTVEMLSEDGYIDALELTAGSSLVNPMYLFRGDVPLKEFAANQHAWILKLGIAMFGKFVFHNYPYEPMYLRETAKQYLSVAKMPLILLGGVTDKDAMDQAMTDGFGYVAMGRAILREPDLINRIMEDEKKKSLCIHCNRCMPTIYVGTHCTEIPGASALYAAPGQPGPHAA